MDGHDEAAPFRPGSTGDDGSTIAIALPWSEVKDREFKDVFASALIVLLLAFAVVGLANEVRAAPGNHLGSAAFAFGLSAVAVLSWYGPFGTVGLVAAVDDEGLTIRHMGWRLPFITRRIELSMARFLPAAEIGIIELVTDDKRRRLWTRALSLNYRGRRLGWTTVTIDRETTEAVFIEQLSIGGNGPWWLVRCADCSSLIAALKLARSGADI